MQMLWQQAMFRFKIDTYSEHPVGGSLKERLYLNNSYLRPHT